MIGYNYTVCVSDFSSVLFSLFILSEIAFFTTNHESVIP